MWTHTEYFYLVPLSDFPDGSAWSGFSACAATGGGGRRAGKCRPTGKEKGGDDKATQSSVSWTRGKKMQPLIS